MPEDIPPYGWTFPLGTDFFKGGWEAMRALASDISATLQSIDNRLTARATHIVTSATRPSNPVHGQKIYETDTQAFGHWDASGVGAWRMFDTVTQTYTVSWTAPGGTAPVLGNASLTGRYQRMGLKCWVSINQVMGSTTTMGTGPWNYSLPFAARNSTTPANSGEQWLPCKIWMGLGNMGGLAQLSGSNAIPILPTSASNVALGTLPGGHAPSGASSHNLTIEGVYELAA